MTKDSLAAAVLTLVSLSVAASAHAATPVPPFPRDGRLAVAGVEDDFEGLRAFLRTHQSPVGAQYHAAIVAYSDPLDRDGPDYGDESGQYIDRVVETWSSRVDRESAVLVVLAIRNRDIIVHPFSRWAGLGWEASEVVRTIDSSPFAVHARSGDYGEAVRQLVLSIDAELGERLHRQREDTERARVTVASVRARVAAWDARAARVTFTATSARRARDEALRAVDEADRSLTIGSPTLAAQESRRAEQRMSAAEQGLSDAVARDGWLRAELPALRRRMEELDRDLAREAFLEDARSAARYASAELARAEAALAAGDLDSASLAESNVRFTIARAESEAERTRREHVFWTRTFPIGLTTVIALALVVLLLLRRLASRRKRAEAEHLVTQWEQLVGQASGNLISLSNEHPIVLGRPDLVEHFHGATAELVRQAARRVDDLFLALDVAQRMTKAGRAALSDAGIVEAFREEPFARIVRSLTLDEIVARTEDVRPRRLFLPEEREVRMSPRELLHEMSAAYDDAQRLVTAIETRFTAAWGGLDRARADLVGVEQACAVALGEGVLVPSFGAERDRLASTGAEIAARAERDPIGCEQDIAAHTSGAASLRARAERIAAALRRLAEQVAPGLAGTRARIAELRAEGMFLAEPGFEPEVSIAHVERSIALARRASEEAADERADAEAKEASDAVTELADLVELSHSSRERTPAAIVPETARLEALRARLGERKERLTALTREHADSALRPALDNVEEAAEVLRRADECLRESARCVAATEQRYLAGAELLARAVADLDAVEALYAEIEDKAATLATSRANTESTWTAQDALSAELERMTAGGDAFASEATLSERARIQAAVAATRAVARGPRPDWIALERESTEALDAATELLRRAQQEHSAWQEVTRSLAGLDSDRARIAQILGRSEDDLANTNRAFADACEALNEAHASAGVPRPVWPDVLSLVRNAARRLAESERMAERDFEEARESRAAIAAAADAIRRADTSYGYGIAAGLGSARSASARAGQLLAQRDYREALRIAREAQNEAESAARQARRQVEAAQDAERARQRRAAEAARAASFSSSSSRSSFGSSSRSSFGSSSSSGRSSFGSSSGRSSFGRSSGRSKW